jgi:hypothetical protein
MFARNNFHLFRNFALQNLDWQQRYCYTSTRLNSK